MISVHDNHQRAIAGHRGLSLLQDRAAAGDQDAEVLAWLVNTGNAPPQAIERLRDATSTEIDALLAKARPLKLGGDPGPAKRLLAGEYPDLAPFMR